MHITIITDCRDENAKGRQITRATHLFSSVAIIGVASDIEAAGNVIDVLDSADATPQVIVINVAPRNGDAKRHQNGTPFGYTRIGDTLVVSTIDGKSLSLLKKLQLIDGVQCIDTVKAATRLLQEGYITKRGSDATIHGQFRSFDFLPFAAAYLSEGNELPHEHRSLSDIEDIGKFVWWIDNFGNCKTTIVTEELALMSECVLRIGTFPVYEQLRDVPDGTIALTHGSSGFGTKRFVEIAQQGGNAANALDLTTGAKL